MCPIFLQKKYSFFRNGHNFALLLLLHVKHLILYTVVQMFLSVFENIIHFSRVIFVPFYNSSCCVRSWFTLQTILSTCGPMSHYSPNAESVFTVLPYTENCFHHFHNFCILNWNLSAIMLLLRFSNDLQSVILTHQTFFCYRYHRSFYSF